MHEAHESRPLHVYSVGQAYLVCEGFPTKSFVIVYCGRLLYMYRNAFGCIRGSKALHRFRRKFDDEQEVQASCLWRLPRLRSRTEESSERTHLRTFAFVPRDLTAKQSNTFVTVQEAGLARFVFQQQREIPASRLRAGTECPYSDEVTIWSRAGTKILYIDHWQPRRCDQSSPPCQPRNAGASEADTRLRLC